MHQDGYAFKPNAKELSEQITRRYEEIRHLAKDIKWSVSTHYGRNSFRGECLSEEAKKLSDLDLLILADSGNLCFGGYCSKHEDGTFHGSYYTD